MMPVLLHRGQQQLSASDNRQVIPVCQCGQTLKTCREYQSCKARSVKWHIAFIALCVVAFLYCKNKAMIQKSMAAVFFVVELSPETIWPFFSSVLGVPLVIKSGSWN